MASQSRISPSLVAGGKNSKENWAGWLWVTAARLALLGEAVRFPHVEPVVTA